MLARFIVNFFSRWYIFVVVTLLARLLTGWGYAILIAFGITSIAAFLAGGKKLHLQFRLRSEPFLAAKFILALVAEKMKSGVPEAEALKYAIQQLRVLDKVLGDWLELEMSSFTGKKLERGELAISAAQGLQVKMEMERRDLGTPVSTTLANAVQEIHDKCPELFLAAMRS